MRMSVALIACLLWTGCRTDVEVPDGFCEHFDLKGTVEEDLGDMAALPKCAAAKGLLGDNLLCVDFNQISSLADPRLSGWDFTTVGGGCWEIAGGNLQIKMFDQFTGTCEFKLPAIDLTQPQYSRYNSITLALRHKVDIELGVSFPNQFARIYLGPVNPATLVTTVSEHQIEQQLTLSVDKLKLPVVLNNVFQWLLQVSAFQKQNRQGWQISSIAVMGNP